MERFVHDDLAEYLPRVYRFALQLCNDTHTAEDITQETLFRAWKARRRLRKADDHAVQTWLFRTAHNVWRDTLRRRRTRHDHQVELAEQNRSPVFNDATHTDDRATRVLRIMRHLPDRQREVLHLAACETLSNDAIAEVLGISSNAVKANLSLARQRVREALNESSETTPKHA